MHTLMSFIEPVLGQVENSYIQQELIKSFKAQEPYFQTIEQSFHSFTGHVQSPDSFRKFFHSWSQTNNSAVTVSGLSNRLSLLVHEDKPVADKGRLLDAIASLNRITDEDLAVKGHILHSDLFYRMATEISGDDAWMLKAYLLPEARSFKSWKDKNSLRKSDLMIGLLTTLAHEIYTHGEVEFILPLFRKWLKHDYGWEDKRIEKSLAWIQVHCGPTEKDHFFHAINAVEHFADAMDIDLAAYDLSEIVSDYVAKKAAVMAALTANIAVQAA
ncbi:hypothetical protein [Kordiimonas laminariae]|uniref:hypothetical protein n=1 Tax=Kordiimonas laminariae TaxID=2917717 RepID=UPI001FF3D912|nr:hypothetical protein [Kordiimonas laminariae]MCK0070771.1 hypothetical protein [Kordiimonas laminariae]